jgi:predicted RNase H-like HicB family nuclease
MKAKAAKGKTQIVHLPLTVERSDDGYLASCPLIQGAFAEGDTIEEAIFNCLDVIKMIFAYRRERGEPVLQSGILEELKAREKGSFTIPLEV